MIIGNLSHWPVEEQAYSTAIRKAMDYLRVTDFKSMEKGKHEIDGSQMFCMIIESTTKPKQELKAESHQTYMDIQYILQGEEKIGCARLTESQVVTSNLLEASDALLYDELQDEIELILREGMYAMFFPADLHRPGIMLQEESALRKVVVKIKLDK